MKIASNSRRYHASERLARVEPLGEVVEQRDVGRARFRVGGDEHEALHARRVPQREALRDEPAHRVADDVRALDAQVLEQRRTVVRHRVDARRRIVGSRAADATVVGRDDPKARGERAPYGQP